ncbi:hypothetical protein BDZ94DRAFT_348121 [Collybia nuda]|uniref:Uncharacterized protein n=1 Tax=Collybia nuda TaxID=64659 RepID=A0A9P5YA50_9AGAR|nr:hypothetical protein BDZ94DRAFT_348121 [Collybia nuda]
MDKAFFVAVLCAICLGGYRIYHGSPYIYDEQIIKEFRETEIYHALRMHRRMLGPKAVLDGVTSRPFIRF